MKYFDNDWKLAKTSEKKNEKMYYLQNNRIMNFVNLLCIIPSKTKKIIEKLKKKPVLKIIKNILPKYTRILYCSML